MNAYDVLMQVFRRDRLLKAIEELKIKMKEFFPEASEEEIEMLVVRVFDDLLREIDREIREHPEVGLNNLERMIKYIFLTRYGIFPF